MAANDMPVYYVGQRPQEPVAIDVRDSNGRSKNLSNYTAFEVIMLGSDNEQLDLEGSFLTTSGAPSGRFVFRFPTERTLFEKPGDYVMQLVMYASSGAVDMTSAQTIRVKKLGGK